MTVIRYWFVSQPRVCPGLTLPLFKEGDGHTYSYRERRFHRIQKKSITLKNYMLHVLKIGRTLRHYMLPCQTANQHFLHFSKEGGGNGGGNGGGERSRYTMYTIFRIQCWPYYIDAMLVISDRITNFHKQSSVSGVHYLYYPPTNFPVMLKMKRRKR